MLTLAQRCKLATDCLPKAEYRTRLEALHAELLALADSAAQQVAAERERWEAVVFDGWRVLKGLDEAAAKRTTHQNVSDTLDALMRVLRA